MPRVAEPEHDPAPPLACVVAGADGEHVSHLVELLERSARVGRVERAGTEVVLRHALAVQHRDLVVVVLDAPDRLLPASLLRYPDTRVLVVAPDGVHGTLSRWLQQGANDLVSPHDDDALSHALGRLVDECALAATARRLATVIETQRRRIETLMSRLDEGGRDAATAARTPLLPAPAARAEGRADDGRRGGPAADAPPEAVDPASRLPTRAATLAALERLGEGTTGDAPAPAGLMAVQVVLPAGSVHDRLDATLTTLAVCRAAEVMRRALPPMLVCGRTRRDTLLAVCEDAAGAAGGQDAAARLAMRLGSLGGLVERAGDLRVDALGGPRATIATAALAERLERRAHEAMVAGAAIESLDDRFPDPEEVVRETAPEASGTRAATRYIGERSARPGAEAPLDDSLVPILTQRSASARFERPAAGA